MRTFHALDTSAPIQPSMAIAAAPDHATLKGMFFSPLVDRARSAGTEISTTRYLAFKDYPIKEWMRVLVDAAAVLHPSVPAREGIRRLGREAHTTFLASTIGKVVMSIAARDFEGAIRLLPKAYSVVGSHIDVKLESHEPKRAVFVFKGAYDWVDAYHAGVLEGGAKHFGVDVNVRAADLKPDGGILELTW